MSRGRGLRSRRGVALVEVLVAFTILAIGMAAVTGMLTLASRALRHAEESFRGALVAAGIPEGTGSGEVPAPTGMYRWRRLPGGGIEMTLVPPTSEEPDRVWILETGLSADGGSP